MLRTLESHKKVQLLFSNLVPRHGMCDRYQVHTTTADWIRVKPKGNCDGTPILGTQDAIFNRISLRLKLKKRDFQTSRIQ